jgi:hypothetical protein
MHFMYGLANGDAVAARRLYQGRYLGQRCLDRRTFVRIHCQLCEHGNFAPRVADRGRPRSTTPEVEDDILDVLNGTPGISRQRISVQVGVTHLTVWMVLLEQQLQCVQALTLQDYPA